MNPQCLNCDGTGWVCENHPGRPWADAPSKREDACACGAGAPCKVCNDSDVGQLSDIAGVFEEVRTIVTVHLAHAAVTNERAPHGPALIIGPSGVLEHRVLSNEELALFASDDRSGTFEAKLIDDTWRLIRRAGAN